LATARQQAALGLQELLIEAVRLLNSADTLRVADVELDKLRFYLRLSHDLGYINLAQQRHAGQMLAEIGRLRGTPASPTAITTIPITSTTISGCAWWWAQTFRLTGNAAALRSAAG
jgi:hypothetical protein